MSQPFRHVVARPPAASDFSDEDLVLSALRGLGGAAHVDDIIQRVAQERGRRGLTGGPSVQLIVESALNFMRTPEDRPYGSAGGRVYRPFGAASRRWAVCRDHSPPSISAAPPSGLGQALLKR